PSPDQSRIRQARSASRSRLSATRSLSRPERNSCLVTRPSESASSRAQGYSPISPAVSTPSPSSNRAQTAASIFEKSTRLGASAPATAGNTPPNGPNRRNKPAIGTARHRALHMGTCLDMGDDFGLILDTPSGSAPKTPAQRATSRTSRPSGAAPTAGPEQP